MLPVPKPLSTPRPNERAKWLRQPVWSVTQRPGASPWPEQKEILNAVRDHKFVAVGSHDAIGKTRAAARATIR